MMRVGPFIALLAVATASAATLTKKPAATKKKTTKSKAKSNAKSAAKRAKPVATQIAATEGRVKYGRDNMPPGFTWPPNPAMKAAGAACEHDLYDFGVHWEAGTPEGKIADPLVVPAMEIGGIKY